MPAYLINHAKGQGEDIFVEDPTLVLTFDGPWAVFTEDDGIALAVPVDQIASIQRVDELPQDQQPEE